MDPGNAIDFHIKLLGALSVGDVRTGTIPSLLPSQKHYLKVYNIPWSLLQDVLFCPISTSGSDFNPQNT
ncbi:MAG: hypothetical protein V1736_03655 [Pseudomonadota bacterium]